MGYYTIEPAVSGGVGNQKSRVEKFSDDTTLRAHPCPHEKPVSQGFGAVGNDTCTVSVRLYGYRYYSPELGRWVNRDPIGERGGLNVYGFVANDAILYLDPMGLRRLFKSDPGMSLADFAYLLTRRAINKTRNSPGGQREYCGRIVECGKTRIYFAYDPHPGAPMPTTAGSMTCNTARPYGSLVDLVYGTGFTHVASYHTHPNESSFSAADIAYAHNHEVPLYLGKAQSGTVWRWDPNLEYSPDDPDSGAPGEEHELQPPESPLP